MEKVIFLADLREEVGSFSEVNSINQRFEDYRLENINGEKYIIGEGAAEFLVSGEGLAFKNFEVITSMLKLVKGELPETFIFPNPKRNGLEKVISDKSILAWVNKYGIPYIDRDKNGEKNELADRFNVERFRFYVAQLQARFLIWKAIIEEDNEAINKYSSALLTVKPGVDLKTIKKALAKEIGAAANMRLTLRYDDKTDRNEFVIYTDSLLSIAYYQFSIWLTKPEAEGKKHMKNCQACNSLFLASHKSKKYCSNPKCNRKNHYYHSKTKKS